MKWNSFQLFNLLKPAPYTEVIQDPTQVNEQYQYWRIRICYSLFIGYAFYYFTRKSFAVIMPVVGADLGLSKAQLGLLLSGLSISYGVSKFLSGILSDRSNPRYFMAIGLMMTGVLNILFGLSSSFAMLALFWALNGFFQAWGWPACCKSLTYWFAKSNRGLWYSICSTSYNIGGVLIALFAPFIALQFGWRYAMFIPGVTSIVMGLVLINRLRDVPQTLGLPPVDEIAYEKSHASLNIKEVLFTQVLNNKYVWIFSLSYFFIYIVRTAINDWSPFYLMEVRNFPDTVAASRGVVWFEVGGLIGMLTAGWGSDYLFKGNRVPAMVIAALGLMSSVMALWYCPPNLPILDLFYLGCIGFFVYGPQMIVGLAAAEFVDKRAAAASNGFAGFVGYIGAAVAGYPVGKIIELWSWNGFYISMLISSAVLFFMLIPLWSASPKKQAQVFCQT